MLSRTHFPTRWLLALLAVHLIWGCSPPPPDKDVPPGAWLVGSGGQVDRLLAMLGSIERTPLAERALEARRRLGGCRTVLGHLPPKEKSSAEADGEEVVVGPDLFGALRCAAAEEIPPALAALALGEGLTFAVPLAPGARLVGFAALDDQGNLQLEARTAGPAGSHPLSMILPGTQAAGTMLFHDRDALLHGRVRTHQDIDLAAWVPEGGGADQLFRLKSKLFSSLVLEGTWEVAIYLPLPNRAMPDVVLALGVKDRERAEEAVDLFLDSLGENWPLRRTAIAGERGECLHNVQILPELAPCWLSLPDAIAIGWNEGSLQRALYEEFRKEGVADLQQGAAMAVFLDRFPAADFTLGQMLAEEVEPEPPITFPWRRLMVAGERAEGAYRFRLQMVADPNQGGGAGP